MVISLDEVDDLTRFADESFDTDAVDLFEFTGNADSLLTRLKSIILSLDWEITDDILDELAEELAYLRTVWEDDKVAQVYLQGLDKIGKYLRIEGAYAHQNAIKLLLTLFYDYEKIISSPDISEDIVTSLLKSDIRKFKVLQYQIGLTKGAPVDSTDQAMDSTVKQGSQESENKILANIEATILGLDWEITDEGLINLNRQAGELSEHLSDNNYAQIMIQGLQAIGAYISEQMVNAHPDAYTLLHSFYDGLKILVADNDLDSEKRQEIIIERVNLLNSLKEIIAGTTAPEPIEVSGEDIDHVLEFENPEQEEKMDTVGIDFSDNEATDEVVDTAEATAPTDKSDIDLNTDDSMVDQPTGVQESEEEIGAVASLSAEDEFDTNVQETTDSVNAAMETADEQYPEEILDPDAIQPLSDEIADEFIEEELSISSKWQPALDDSDEVGLRFEPEDEGMNEENLEEELDLLFSDEDELEKIGTSGDMADDSEFEELALAFDEEETVEKDSGSRTPDLIESPVHAEQDDGNQSSAGGEELVTPALADSDEESGFTEDVESAAGLGEEPSAELEDKLDSFFGISDDEERAPAADELVTPVLADDEDQVSADDEELVTPALADSDEEGGFTEDVESAGLGEEPSAELEDKLDSFFGISDDEERAPAADELVTPVLADDEDQSSAGDEETVTPALADSDEEGGFTEDVESAGLGEEPSAELEDKLDSFFGISDDEERAPAADELVTPVLADDEDQVSADDEETVTAALADSDEEGGFTEDVESAGLGEEPSAELEDKLDSFFNISEEEPDIIDQEPETAPTEIIDVAEDTVVAALTDADETVEGGFREEEVVTNMAEDPTYELQDKLDSFFDDHEPETESAAYESSSPLDEDLDIFLTEEETSKTDQEVDETMPALADADENSGFDEDEAVATLTDSADSAMEEIDDKLDSFFDIDKEDSDQIATTPISTLASLAATAASLSTSPAANDLQQVADLVAIGKKEYQGTQQAILLTLIDSAVALLGKQHEAAASSSAIVQELVAGLEDADNPNTLIEAVSRYTSWQQDFFDKSISSQELTDTVTPTPATEIADNDVMLLVQSGFSQLRSTLMNEFESIRKELKKE